MIMTEDLYVLMNGGDDIIGQSIIYQSSHESRITDLRDAEKFNKMLGEIVETNYKLRIEFRKKVDSGEIYKDTVVDRLIASARGHEDNEATWAARRCLLKRGIDI